MKLSVIIITCNRCDEVIRLLKSCENSVIEDICAKILEKESGLKYPVDFKNRIFS